VLKSEIHFPKRNARSNVTVNKYKKQLQWRQNKVRELLTRRYSQKEISSTLYISQPTVSRNISFIKNNFQKEFDANNTKSKFAEDYCMAQMSFDGIKKNLWQIVDNKKTKPRDKIQALKQLADITVETLEFIPLLDIMLRVNKLNEDLKKREKMILVMEKIFKEHANIDTKSSEGNELEKFTNK
jgi:predicted transcriptional regulator